MALTDNTAQAKTQSILCFLLVLIPIIIYGYCVFHFALNKPHWDDYDAVLGFLNRWDATPAGQKASLLLLQHNEHRILMSRMAYVLYHWLFSTINFQVMIYWNFVWLLGIFGVMAWAIRKLIPTLWQWALVPVSFALFDPIGYENANFAMAGMQNYGVILLFLLAMMLYTFKGKWLIPAILVHLLCTLSSGNGAIASLFLLLYLLLTSDMLAIGVCLAVSITGAALYYYNYQKGAVDFSTHAPWKIIPFFFHATGAHFGYRFGAKLAAGMMALLAWSLFPFKKSAFNKPLAPLLSLTCFCFATIAAMAVFRGNLPIQVSTSSRYSIYSSMLCGIVAVLVITKFQGTKFQKAAITSAIGIIVLSFAKNIKPGVEGFISIRNKLAEMKYAYPDAKRAQQIADESCRRRIYCIQANSTAQN